MMRERLLRLSITEIALSTCDPGVLARNICWAEVKHCLEEAKIGKTIESLGTQVGLVLVI